MSRNSKPAPPRPIRAPTVRRANRWKSANAPPRPSQTPPTETPSGSAWPAPCSGTGAVRTRSRGWRSFPTRCTTRPCPALLIRPRPFSCSKINRAVVLRPPSRSPRVHRYIQRTRKNKTKISTFLHSQVIWVIPKIFFRRKMSGKKKNVSGGGGGRRIVLLANVSFEMWSQGDKVFKTTADLEPFWKKTWKNRLRSSQQMSCFARHVSFPNTVIWTSCHFVFSFYFNFTHFLVVITYVKKYQSGNIINFLDLSNNLSLRSQLYCWEVSFFAGEEVFVLWRKFLCCRGSFCVVE